MSTRHLRASRGPFRADQIRDGDAYELSDGHVLECLPTGRRGALASRVGSAVLGSDPDAESVGIDAGFSPEPGTLRAPDLAVGNLEDAPGWAPGVPQLAVEYADRGQDEPMLAVKIQELLAGGTHHVWVVRLDGPRRVEVHEPGKEVRLAWPGDQLEAPGILRNPVPVEALYDPDVGERVTLRNLLQRQGYDDLEAVRVEAEVEGQAKGRAEGELVALRESLLEILAARGLTVSEPERGAVETCADRMLLKTWLRGALTATSAGSVLATRA